MPLWAGGDSGDCCTYLLTGVLRLGYAAVDWSWGDHSRFLGGSKGVLVAAVVRIPSCTAVRFFTACSCASFLLRGNVRTVESQLCWVLHAVHSVAHIVANFYSNCSASLVGNVS